MTQLKEAAGIEARMVSQGSLVTGEAKFVKKSRRPSRTDEAGVRRGHAGRVRPPNPSIGEHTIRALTGLNSWKTYPSSDGFLFAPGTAIANLFVMLSLAYLFPTAESSRTDRVLRDSPRSVIGATMTMSSRTRMPDRVWLAQPACQTVDRLEKSRKNR